MKNSKLGRFVAASIVLLAGFLIAWKFYENTVHQIQDTYVASFELNSSNNSLLLKSEMNENSRLLSSFAAFFRASSFVDKNEFELFTFDIMKRAEVLGFCWHDDSGKFLAQISKVKSFDFCSNFSLIETNKAFVVPSPHIILSTYVSTRSEQKGYISVVMSFRSLFETISYLDHTQNSLILGDMGKNIFLNYAPKSNSMEPLQVEHENRYFETRSYDIMDFSNMKFIYHARLASKEFFPQGASLATLILIIIVSFLTSIYLYLIIGKNHDIEMQVDLKTSELQEQVQRSEKLAAAKSEFLANMSHEIRTPLNGVMGMLELIERNELSETNKNFLENAVTANDMLLRVLNDILDLSKIDALKLEVESIEFNLKNILREVELMITPEVNRKNLLFKIDFNLIEGKSYLGDPIRIKQIVLNLLSNAVKFTTEGFVKISVKEKSLNAEKSMIFIEVKDSGVGISNENTNKIFEKFSQADSSITRQFGGSGLGLAISKKLSQLMGGNIVFESTAGVGSTFTASFTLDKLDSENISLEQKTHTNVPGPSKINLADKLILVAEDNLLNQKVILGLLKKLECRVLVVDDGEQAVNMAITNQDIDLILMDIQMPRLDGIAATKKILKELGSAAPSIIAITANTFEDDKEACRAAGMVGFLPKPISIKAVKEIIEKFT